MTQLFVQTVPRHAGWLLVGPPAATSLVPQQDITVTFSDSSSVVIPAGVPAQLPGGGTTWDRTQQVVVGYVVPGSGTLLACLEAQLAALTTDYAPLVRVLADAVQVYQPQQPGGAAIKSGAWSGGALLSSARAWQGGASASGLPVSLSGGAWGTNQSALGLYFKVPSAPSADMTLLDWSFGATGYWRIKLTSALRVVLEFSLLGGTGTGGGSTVVDAQIVVAAGNWYWVSSWANSYRGVGGYFPSIQAWTQGGSTPGTQQGADIAGGGSGFALSYTGTFGLGIALSTSYLAFPNTAGWECSKCVIVQPYGTSGTPISPPSSDMVPDVNTVALYNARQAVGSTTALADASSNAYTLAAGGQGLTIVADGPFP